MNTDILAYLHACCKAALAISLAAVLVYLIFCAVRHKGRSRILARAMAVFVFAFYVVVVGYITLFSREPGDTKRLYLQPLEYLFTDSPRQIAENTENFLLLFPMGFMLPCLLGLRGRIYRYLWIGFAVSLCIELTQLVTGCGHFQVDDIIYNGIGCMAGSLLLSGICRLIRHMLKT